MKTKKFFMLLAVVLLCGASAFAQTESEPLKGDVNEDGVVDVADINAVIEIMKTGGGTVEPTTYYWYVGTTKPTSLSQATVVDSYESEYIYTNNSGSKAHIFVLTNYDKTLSFRNLTVLAPVSQVEVDTTTFPGYNIYETAVGTANGGSIGIDVGDEWKHFYLGTIPPTVANYETLTPAYSSLSDMNGATVRVPSNGKIYLLVPYSDSRSQAQLKKDFTDNEGNIITYITRDIDNSSIYRHYIWELTFEPETTLTFNMNDD